MTLRILREFLDRSLDDEHLSRGERSVFRELLAEHDPSPREQELLLHDAFALARSRLGDSGHVTVVEWLEDVVKALRPVDRGGPLHGRHAEALFFPSQDSLGRLLDLMEARLPELLPRRYGDYEPPGPREHRPGDRRRHQHRPSDR